MPSGIFMLRYATYVCAALLSAFAGSQCVHMYYKPLEGFPEQVQAKIAELKAQEERDVAQQLHAELTALKLESPIEDQS